jgi:regulatory protein
MTFHAGRRGRRGDDPPTSGAAAMDAEPDQESVARAIALRLLTGAARSRAQLAEAMARKEVPDAVAEKVLDRFTEVGLIDDEEFARMLVRTRHAERGLSRRAIAVELRRKGIDDELAGAALEQLDGDDEELAARALVRRKLASTSTLDVQTRARRTYAALGRKGYPPGLVSRLVREELAAIDSAGELLEGLDGAVPPS